MSVLVLGAFVVAALLAVGVGVALWESYAFWVLWGWYLAPAGLPAVSFGAVFVSVLLVRMLLSPLVSVDPGGDGASRRAATRLASHVVSPALALLIGWLLL